MLSRRTFRITLAVAAASVLVGGGAVVANVFGSPAERVVCSAFASQAAAQRAYRADPVRYRRLDGDSDGVACERNRAPRDWLPVNR